MIKEMIVTAAALCALSGAFADKRIDEIKKAAAAEGKELTFEMSPEGFKYATGLLKPLGGKARVKKDKSFLKADGRIPAKFHIKELLANTTNTALCGIYDQGNCGSCVYNSIAKNFCDSLRLRNVKTPDFLSRQQLMSCSPGGRCNGEWATNVGGYLYTLGGLYDEKDYPYMASSSGQCKSVNGIKYGQLKDKGRVIDNSAKSMFTALYSGYPVSITVGADNAWMSYKSGTYNYCSGAGTNHEILIYGWDCESAVEVVDGKSYCKFDANGRLPNGVGTVTLVNSWGMWGQQGEMVSKLTTSSGRLCNNVTEEAFTLETGIPMPSPKPPEPPAPPVPPTPTPGGGLPAWAFAAIAAVLSAIGTWLVLGKKKS